MTQLARIQNNIVSQSPVDDANLTPSALQEFVEDIIGSKVKGGTNVTVVYNDLTGDTTISATGGGGGGGSTTLDGLTDVTITGATNGQVLKYNGSQWINDTDSTGGGGGGAYNLITNISEMNAAISASSPTSGLEYTVAAGTYNFTANTTLPAGLKLKLDKGAKLTINTGATLTINARIDADPYYEIFGGDGTIALNAGSMDYVSVMHFGAKGDGVTDDTSAFNRTIDATKYIQKVRIPATKDFYVISSTINVTRTIPDCPECFSNYQIFGDAAGERVDPTRDLATTIKYIGTSGPCINLAEGRFQTKIRDISFLGYNTAPGYMCDQSRRASINTWNWENWVGYVYHEDDGLGGNSGNAGTAINNGINNALIASSTSVNPDFEFDHYCAIAVDWGGPGDRPSGQRWAAQLYIENIKIVDFVVAISISPNTSVQGDTIWVRDCKIDSCVYGAAIGQDQARSITFENIWMDKVYCAYTNLQTGRKNGSAFNITGGQYTTIFKLFDMTAAYRGQMHVSGLFSEACGYMGNLYGLGVNTNAAVFNGCEFGFDSSGYLGETGVGHFSVPFNTFTVGTNVTFTGCNFHSNPINDKLQDQGYVYKAFIEDSNTDLSSVIISKMNTAYPLATTTAVRIKRNTYRITISLRLVGPLVKLEDAIPLIITAIQASGGPTVTKLMLMHSLDVFCFAGAHYNFQGCTFTQNYKIYNPLGTISIFGGSSLFNDLSIGYLDSDDVNPEDNIVLDDNRRCYVAPTLRQVTIKSTAPSYPFKEVKNVKFAVPEKYFFGQSVTFPVTTSKVFTVSVSTDIAQRTFIGDHVLYVLGNTPNSGTDQSNGGAAVPCLEVIGKTSNTLTLRKICPEANIDGRTVFFEIYNGWNLFVSPTQVQATGGGTNVTINPTTISYLKEGDVIRDSQNGNITRVLSMTSTNAVFADSVQNGSLLQSVIV